MEPLQLVCVWPLLLNCTAGILTRKSTVTPKELVKQRNKCLTSHAQQACRQCSPAVPASIPAPASLSDGQALPSPKLCFIIKTKMKLEQVFIWEVSIPKGDACWALHECLP